MSFACFLIYPAERIQPKHNDVHAFLREARSAKSDLEPTSSLSVQDVVGSTWWALGKRQKAIGNM